MIMLNSWHPDVVEFILSKVQNPKVLQFIIQNTESDLIRREAQRKLKFIPLTETERFIYQQFVDKVHVSPSESKQYDIAYEKAKQILEDNGTWTVHHPEFLAGANISVCLTKEFMKAVEEDIKVKLQFPDLENYDEDMRKIYNEEWQECGDVREWEKRGYGIRTYHTIRAKQLWDLINICATYSAEPGIFFLDTANDMTNARAYGQKVVATNPCGEQPLAPWSVCNLAAVNLANMATEDGKVDFDKLRRTVRIGTRMQDNVIDATPYFLEENKKQALGERRIGMGVMGLHDLLIKCEKEYGSPEGNEIVDQIFECMAITAYEESIELAKTRGSFPFLDSYIDVRGKGGRERFINSGYMKKMPQYIRDGILEHGIRNSHLLTVAPTGSTGTMINVSTGLEPYFNFLYYRSGRLGQYIPVVAEAAEQWLRKNGYDVDHENAEELIQHLPSFFIGAMDLSPEAHVAVQCIIQQWVDSSISKTVNAPKGYSVREVEKVYESLYKGGAKGGTVYVDGSRDSQVLNLTNESTSEHIEVDLSEQLDTPFEVLSEHVNLPAEAYNTITVEENIVYHSNKKEGTSDGDLCPVCHIGTIREHGGCNTCDNCKAQVSCGL